MSDLPNDNTVGAWMNAPEHTIAPDATADEAFQLMRRANIRHLLVMSGDDLVGVVTDRDLRRPDWSDGDVLSVREMYKLGDDLRVEDLMTSDVTTAAVEDLTSDAARIMVENKFNCLPVVRDETVVGIITSADLLAALVHEVDPDFIAAREAEAG